MSPSERLLDILLPRTCCGCREDLPPPLSGPLCGDCLLLLKPRRKAPANRGLAWLKAAEAAYAYRAPVPALLHAFKYEGRASVGAALGGWMAGLWPGRERLGACDALVPVPLHRARERARGFNQALILAKAVARSARTPVIEALLRTRAGAAQARSPRAERAGKLRGAFRLKDGVRVEGLRLVLIDDVLTSGETLEACARELLKAGAEEVRAFVLARAAT